MKFYKPTFWDNTNFTIWPYILFPFTIIINLINLFKFKFFNKKKFNIPIISVGNIYLGGTGKTPLCIKIFSIVKSLELKPAFVKKHYEKYGDETRLLKNSGKVFSNKKRSEALKMLINDKYQIAILDDGFQDPSIKSNMSIVCFNEKQWIGNGFVIPSGPLREKLTALRRSDYVFINGDKNFKIEKIINKFNSKIKIYYTKYKPINLNEIKDKKVLAFAGIANPENFFDLLKKNNVDVKKTIKFPDHYNFSTKDILNLNKKAKELNAYLLTTEKDYFRLNENNKKNINYLKIDLIIDKKEEFINELKKLYETF